MKQSDPLGRRTGSGAQLGTQDSLLQGEDVYRRARELLDEIRRRSGQGQRPDVELEYLRRLAGTVLSRTEPPHCCDSTPETCSFSMVRIWSTAPT